MNPDNNNPQQPTVPVLPVVPAPDSLAKPDPALQDNPTVNFPSPPPPVKKNSPLILIAIVLVVLALLAAIAYVIGMQFFGQKSIFPMYTPQQACTEEAKLCDDGSSVGRTGPNCEFAECPIVIETPTVIPTMTATPSGTPTMSPTTSPSSTPSATPQ